MKRPLVALVALGLAACAGLTAPGSTRSETPAHSLAAAGQRMSQLQSLRFDLAGTYTLTLPQQIVDQLRAKGGAQANFLSGATTVNLHVTGAAQRPDKLQATVTARIGGVTIRTEVRAVGGTVYYQDPITLKWEAVSRDRIDTQKDGRPKLSYQTLLDTAKSITEVGGTTTINGVSAEHYRVVPDLVKLFAQIATKLESKDPQAAAVVQEALRGVNLTVDVWTGADDHLIRRLSYDLDASVDLHQLAALDPHASQAGWNVPAGSTAHLTAHVVINLHDFNAPVSVTAPTVGS